MKRKTFLLTTSLVFLLLTGCSQESKVINLIKQEQYGEAHEVYTALLTKDDKVDMEKFKKEIQDAITSQITSDFEKQDFDTAVKRMTGMSEFEFLQGYLSSQKQLAKELQLSYSSIAEATVAYKEGNFEKALPLLTENISKNDKENYPKAKQMIDDIYLQQGKQFIEKQAIEDAITSLEQVSSDNKNHEEATKLIETTKKKYIDSKIAEAYENYKKEDYSASYSAIEEALKYNSSEDLKKVKRYYEILSKFELSTVGPKPFYYIGSNGSFFSNENTIFSLRYYKDTDEMVLRAAIGDYEDFNTIYGLNGEDVFAIPFDMNKKIKNEKSTYVDIPVESIEKELEKLFSKDIGAVTFEDTTRGTGYSTDFERYFKESSDMFTFYKLRKQMNDEFLSKGILEKL